MPEPRARFTVAGPDLPTDAITVTSKGLKIGRLADNDLPLNHQKISRNHARIVWAGDHFTIEDLNSSNGTIINDGRIEPGKPSIIKPGDVIRLGPFTLTFEKLDIEGAEPVPPPLDVKPAPKKAPEEPPPLVTPPPTIPPSAAESGPPTPAKESPAKEKEIVVTPVKVAPPTQAPEPTLPGEPPKPILVTDGNGHAAERIEGIPTSASSYLQYLPGIFSDDDFLGRYLLVPESLLAPIEWGLDSIEGFLDHDIAPLEWLQWIASWFDIYIHPSIPEVRQRAVVGEIGKLYLIRGTLPGMTRLLELYFGVKPEIEEPEKPPSSFIVKLKLGAEATPLNRILAQRLIESQKPAHTSFTLEIS